MKKLILAGMLLLIFMSAQAAYFIRSRQGSIHSEPYEVCISDTDTGELLAEKTDEELNELTNTLHEDIKTIRHYIRLIKKEFKRRRIATRRYPKQRIEQEKSKVIDKKDETG
jgi:Skp family chaperone for outer membrane proteins